METIDSWKTWKHFEKFHVCYENLAKCVEEIFPFINRLSTIFITLIISNVNAELTFSTIRKLKTSLKLTMSEIRLTGLVFLIIHRDIDVGIIKVIDRFSKTKRNLDFA